MKKALVVIGLGGIFVLLLVSAVGWTSFYWLRKNQNVQNRGFDIPLVYREKTGTASATPTVIMDTTPEATPVVTPVTIISGAQPTPATIAINFEDFKDEVLWPRDQLAFVTENVPNSVDISTVDYAHGNGFEPMWPPMAHIFAADGKLVVGPDFPKSLVDASNGATEYANGGNQYRITNNDFHEDGCNEGSFISVDAQYASFTFANGMVISYRVPDGSNGHFFARCPNANSALGSDDNNLGTLWIAGYKPSHALLTHFSGQPPGGFVSGNGEKQALEMSTDSSKQGGCGNGCVSTYIFGLDTNTGAFSITMWDGTTMSEVYSNWWTPAP